MHLKKLEKVEDVKHGDIVCVVSYEQNCGIDEGAFKSIVIDSKQNGLVLVLENFEEYVFRAVERRATSQG